ncbi:MAG TPA: hypothetical protein PKE66_13540 [Pyrinomonadaceae bacterium]|nr:hypothetical protein [Pyrinomonadaceae bacterium]
MVERRPFDWAAFGKEWKNNLKVMSAGVHMLLHIADLLLPFLHRLFDLTKVISLTDAVKIPTVHFLFHVPDSVEYLFPMLLDLTELILEPLSLIGIESEPHSLVFLLHVLHLVPDAFVLLPRLVLSESVIAALFDHFANLNTVPLHHRDFGIDLVTLLIVRPDKVAIPVTVAVTILILVLILVAGLIAILIAGFIAVSILLSGGLPLFGLPFALAISGEREARQ